VATRRVTVNDLLDGHVGLDLRCLDRIYLNGYLPTVQVGGQVVALLKHRGYPIPSPAPVTRMGEAFRDAVGRFTRVNAVPVVRFAKGDRKLDVMRPYVARQAATGRSGVAAVGVAQEFQRVLSASTRDAAGGGAPHFSWAKADRRVTCPYFYLWDEDFGPAFIKVCVYFPYPVKIWLNGHEWAKRQATRAGIGFTELSNGFASTDDPAGLQDICDSLGPGAIRVFAERWWARLPLPLGPADRAKGYWWDLSMRQVEVSRTIVFHAPRHGRAFFDALVADNLDIGRPDHLGLIFGRGIRSTTAGVFATQVVTRGVDVTVNAYYKHSRIKQYRKDGRALRIDTVIDNPTDVGCLRRIEHLDELTAKGRDINDRLLDSARVGQGRVLASPAFERVAQPSLVDGRRAPALRFGDPRVMALTGALAVTTNMVTGFTNRSLRTQVAALLGAPYSQAQASYDLRRLRLKGLVRRLEHSNTYVLTGDGQRVAIFYTKLHQRLLRPPPARRRPTTRPAARPASPTDPGPRRHRLHRPRPPRRLKNSAQVSTP